MKIFTKMKHMMLMAAMCWASTALAVNVKGSYAVVADDVKSENAITSVDGITMTYGTDNTWSTSSATVTVDSKTFTVYASGNTNPAPSNGDIPTAGIYVVFEPEHDGTITAVVQNAGNTKSAYIVENSDKNLVDGTVLIGGVEKSWTSGTPLNSDAAYSGGVTFKVKGGSKYYFYIAGSKMRFMGFIYTYDGYGAELVHTASSYCGDPANVFTSTVDAEKEHINNSSFSGKWAGAAYAEFSIEVPEGHSITNASLAWSGVGSGKNRTTDVMYVNAGSTLDYETMKSTGTEKVNLGATKIATVTFTANKTVDFVTDVTEAVTAIMNEKQTYIIFKFTNNVGGGDLVGKGAAEKFPVLTIETAEASAMTTYTVKYVDESGDEIKAESVYDILAGETASIADENKVAIYTNDKKYIYKSCDKESITTVADGASNVITATFREAATCNYTVNAVDGEGNVLKVLAAGSNLEGETVTVPYNQYILKGGVLYEKSAPTSGSYKNQFNWAFSLTSDNMTSDVVYSVSSKTNVVYFGEVEEIEGMTDVTSGNANIRCSNSVGAYNASETPVEVLTLTPGTYTITAQIWGNARKETIDGVETSIPVPLYVNCGDETLEVGTLGYITSGSKEFTITENAKVTIPQAGSAGSSPRILDWILIQSAEANSLLVAEEGKDLDAEGNYASATYTRKIEAGKYGTICLPFAPDVASLENYTFFTMTSAEDGALNFVVDEAPVANKPYIYSLNENKEATAITGAATEVSATTTDVEVNGWIMKGSFTNQTIDATTGNYYGYVASAAEKNIVKANKTLTVKPYRAYFTSEKPAAAVTLRFTRGDETTEISAAELDVQPATVIYDLAGRRVEKMEKGIYIVNGKKVIR